MDIMEVNITQFLDIKNQPFRRVALDYSHLPYADVLDALAATIIVTALTALMMHLTTGIYGMSTRSISIKSLYGGSFLSDINHLLFMFLGKRNAKHKVQWTPRIVAFILLLLLSLAEALLFLSQSTKTERYNLEDLHIRRSQLKPYVGKPFLSTLSRSCTPMIQSQYPIWYSPLDLCVTHPYTERFVPRKQEVDRAMSISVNVRYERGELSFIVITADYGYSLNINIVLHSAPRTIRMNVTNLITDPEELLTFLTDGAAQLLGCPNASEVRVNPDFPDVFSRFLHNCREVDEESLLIGERLVLSTLSLSEEFISATDFYSVEATNFTTKHTPITRASVDGYAVREVVRVRGFILWIMATTLLMINFMLSCIAPDLEMAKSVAVASYLNWANIPFSGSQHVCVPSPKAAEQNSC